MPENWRTNETQLADTANTSWWEQFGDPVLNDLIQNALNENKDLLIAASRIDEYLGRYAVANSSLFPQLTGQANGGRQRVSQVGTVPLSASVDPISNTYTAGLNASWEIDLWGGLRRAKEAARADLLATAEARRGVILTLVSSVANSYINLRSLDRQLEISKETLKTREDSVGLFKDRFAGGVISEVELTQVESEYYSTLASIPVLETAIAQQENALNILLGRNPGDIPRGKNIYELNNPAVPAGLPSEILARRPDILQAEQQLVAANARLGSAQAQFFPTITLTGANGSSSSELSNLFTGPAQTWSYLGNVTGPIFNAGKIRGQVQAARAQRQQAILTYQKSIQNAFREVDDALVEQTQTREQLKSQKLQVEVLTSYNQLAALRYDNGYTSYLEVLDAQRNLFSAELAYTQTQQKLFLSMIKLYAATGGGWIDAADKKISTPETKDSKM